MTVADRPVVVVGAGPVGLAAALELRHHGVRSVVIEPRVVVEHSRPRAKTTSARTMEIFRRWGAVEPLRRAAALSPDWSDRVTFADTVTGAEITHIDGCLGLATPADVSPERAQQVPQGVVEETLRALATAEPGIDLRLGERVLEVVPDRDCARVVVERADGAHDEIDAAWVIGADGARSVVRRAMGAQFEGAAGGRPNVNITFRSRSLADLIPHPPSIHYWSVNPSAPGVVGPLDLDGTWWAISTGTAAIDFDDEAVDIVRGLVGADIDVEVIATDPWQARMLLADRYRNERLFVVGDAAHQNPPWGGHGFNTGVGDAVNLGWKLAAVVNGWAPESLLDSYESERRPIAERTIAVAADNMSTLAVELAEDAGTEDLAARIQRSKGPEFRADGLILGYGYGPSSDFDTASYTPRLRAGARLPHRAIDGVPLFDLLGRELTVLGSGDAAHRLVAAARGRGIPITLVEAPGSVVVVRPDQHIAWVADAGGRADIDADAVLDAALLGF